MVLQAGRTPGDEKRCKSGEWRECWPDADRLRHVPRGDGQRCLAGVGRSDSGGKGLRSREGIQPGRSGETPGMARGTWRMMVNATSFLGQEREVHSEKYKVQNGSPATVTCAHVTLHFALLALHCVPALRPQAGMSPRGNQECLPEAGRNACPTGGRRSTSGRSGRGGRVGHRESPDTASSCR